MIWLKDVNVAIFVLLESQLFMDNNHTGIIIQARTGSVRLPGKMIMPFWKSKSLLEILLLNFIEDAVNVPVVIATTNSDKDNELVDICNRLEVPVYRGDEEDVLSRFIGAADLYGFKTVIRVCADNPFFDLPSSLKLAKKLNESNADYSGFLIGGKPSIKTHIGLWGEAVTVNALKKAAILTQEKIYREHVTNFIYSNPEKFSLVFSDAPYGLGDRTDLRFTLDTASDFELYVRIFDLLFASGSGSRNIPKLIELVDKKAEFMEIMREQIIANNK